jgi:hypothetical protein
MALWIAVSWFVTTMVLKIEAFLRGRQSINDCFTLKLIELRAF